MGLQYQKLVAACKLLVLILKAGVVSTRIDTYLLLEGIWMHGLSFFQKDGS